MLKRKHRIIYSYKPYPDDDVKFGVCPECEKEVMITGKTWYVRDREGNPDYEVFRCDCGETCEVK